MTLEKICDFKVVVANSKKSGQTYIALVADLHYTRKFLSFSRPDIAEMLGMSIVELNALDIGEYDI